jgi:hypothetical protein
VATVGGHPDLGASRGTCSSATVTDDPLPLKYQNMSIHILRSGRVVFVPKTYEPKLFNPHL